MKYLMMSALMMVSTGTFMVSSSQSAVIEKKEFYSCPMHPQVKSDQPGECPICHMTLQKVSTTKDRKIKFYRNPMNPSITSKVPTKDNMGMDYIPVYESEANQSPSEVPGRSAVILDQNQFQLSGAHLITPKRGDADASIPVAGRILSSSQIALQVPEHDLASLKPGLKVDLLSPATGDEILHGKVSSLNSMIDPMTRTLRVNVQLDKSNSALRTEGSIQGYVKKSFNNALTLPQSAILELKGIHYVFVADEKSGTFTPKKIKILSDSVEFNGISSVVIQEGLSEGESVSSGPNFLLDSESRIQVSHDQ